MNNYDNIIEQLHAENMAKREAEAHGTAAPVHRPWPKMTIAATLAAIVGVALLIHLNSQPEPTEMTAQNLSIQPNPTEITASAPTQSTEAAEPSLLDIPTPDAQPRRSVSDDRLRVVCENNCNPEEVLRRFEETLHSLN